MFDSFLRILQKNALVTFKKISNQVTIPYLYLENNMYEQYSYSINPK